MYERETCGDLNKHCIILLTEHNIQMPTQCGALQSDPNNLKFTGVCPRHEHPLSCSFVIGLGYQGLAEGGETMSLGRWYMFYNSHSCQSMVTINGFITQLNHSHFVQSFSYLPQQERKIEHSLPPITAS